MPSDTSKLSEIRENFDYAFRKWKPVREDASKSKRAIAGDPWPEQERSNRKAAKRPCWTFPELGQYINGTTNQFRMNPRETELIPRGGEATEQTAEWLQDALRGISYRSQGKAAILTAFENAVMGNLGFFGFNIDYPNPESFDAEIVFRRFANSNSVIISPDFKLMDGSDIEFAYVIERMPRKQFKKRWKDANTGDFTKQLADEAGEWQGDEETVQVAEYWELTHDDDELLLLSDNRVILKSKLAKAAKVIDSRKVKIPRVNQYLTNGTEILETYQGEDGKGWPGKYIPIVPVFGAEMWVDEDGTQKRKYFSLVHHALEPFLAYCYVRSTEGEIIGMSPKNPYFAARGSVDEDDLKDANRVPVPVVFYDAKVEGYDQLMPPPQRALYDPPIQSLEMAAEAFRRAIQAGIGSSLLPTDAQQINDKSGKALDAIKSQYNLGSYHFADNVNYALEHAGRIELDLFPHVYGNREGRQISLRDKEGKHRMVALDSEADKNGMTYSTDFGDLDVTISTGPSFDSQQEAADDFLQNLVNTEMGPRIADLAVKARAPQIGLMAEKIAERLTPPDVVQLEKLGLDDLPPQAKQAIQKFQQQNQQLNAYAQQQEAQLQELKAERDAKVVENQAKQSLELIKGNVQIEIEKLRLKTQETVAEITTKAQNEQVRAKLENDLYIELHSAAHDVALSAQDHGQTLEQQQQAADNSQVQQTTQIQADQQSQQESQPE